MERAGTPRRPMNNPQKGKAPKPSNYKVLARSRVRVLQKRMQYIAANPRGKDEKGAYMNEDDLLEVLHCNEELFMILSHLLKI